MKIMKIFFPLQVFYPSQAGGPANSIYWLTKNLVRKHFKPIIVSTDIGIEENFPRNKWLENEAGKVIYIKTFVPYFPLYQTFISLKTFHKADLIQLSSVFFPTAFITAFAARIFNKKLIWSARGELDTEALKISPFRKRPILWAIKKFIGNYPYFHSTCDEETIYIKNVFGNEAKIIQIPNFIEIPEKIERTSQNYLLYIGRLHPKKAIDNLLKALSLSEKFKSSSFTLKIAGKGTSEYENFLRQLVSILNLEDRIEFLGQVEGNVKQKLYADAFWTIFPSHTENFGNIVLESLAQNTPVIASKGTPWQILEHEKIGFWIENAPESLADAIDKIFEMPPEIYETYRQNSREFVLQKFDISKNIKKWCEFYKNLA